MVLSKRAGSKPGVSTDDPPADGRGETSCVSGFVHELRGKTGQRTAGRFHHVHRFRKYMVPGGSERGEKIRQRPGGGGRGHNRLRVGTLSLGTRAISGNSRRA